MTYYLIDFENVGCDGMKGIENIATADVVIIFYNETSKIFIKDILAFKSFIDRVEFKMMEHSGSNYLDFYLSATVGMLSQSNAESKVVIVSKDKGYNSVIDFCKDNGFDCTRFPSIGSHISYINNHRENDETIQTVVVDSVTTETEMASVTIESENDVNEDTTVDENSANIVVAETETPAAAQQNAKKTVPEAIRKKVRGALKKDKVESHKYTQIYKAFLAPNKKDFMGKLTSYFGANDAQKYYQKTLQFYKEFLAEGK